jgi:hypothetical protein
MEIGELLPSVTGSTSAMYARRGSGRASASWVCCLASVREGVQFAAAMFAVLAVVSKYPRRVRAEPLKKGNPNHAAVGASVMAAHARPPDHRE